MAIDVDRALDVMIFLSFEKCARVESIVAGVSVSTPPYVEGGVRCSIVNLSTSQHRCVGRGSFRGSPQIRTTQPRAFASQTIN